MSTSHLDTAEYLAIVTDAQAERPPEFSSLVRVDFGALSHRGKVRDNNEDHFLAVRFGRSLVTLKTNVPDELIPARFEETGYGMVVADGMGGAAAGEVASRLAISVGLNLALNSPKWNLIPTPEEIQENMEKWRQRFRQIDYVLTERAEAHPELHGMGTTLTVACSVGADLMLYHVGDSRAYLFRAGRLHRLTRDHTLAQELADAGIISPEEIATHRSRHTLTRVLGKSGGEVQAELQHLHLENEDRLLLCTDGLTDMVSDTRIAEVLCGLRGSHEASRALIDLALDGGGRDNVTVVLARYTIPEASA
jgi:protein phosphatase